MASKKKHTKVFKILIHDSLVLADKLDGLQHRPKHATQSMDEYLQLADEYFARQIREPGKKRVNLQF